VAGGVLYIPSITQEYQGEYQCVVTSEIGDFTASVILIVSGKKHSNSSVLIDGLID
jgi:hypothetical protein